MLSFCTYINNHDAVLLYLHKQSSTSVIMSLSSHEKKKNLGGFFFEAMEYMRVMYINQSINIFTAMHQVKNNIHTHGMRCGAANIHDHTQLCNNINSLSVFML